MKLSELYAHLKTLDVPIQYHHFEIGQVPNLPYVIYYNPKKTTKKADNINYLQYLDINIELYAEHKDIELENKLEALLNTLQLTYTYQEEYISEEKMYLILYEITVKGE